MKIDKEKEENKFYSSGKNFYKLFNDNERKAISVLFNSAEGLIILNKKQSQQKIGIKIKKEY